MWPKLNLRTGVIAISAPIFHSTPRIAQCCIGEGETTSTRCCTTPTRHDEYFVLIHGLTEPHPVDRTWKPPRWKPRGIEFIVVGRGDFISWRRMSRGPKELGRSVVYLLPSYRCHLIGPSPYVTPFLYDKSTTLT